MLKIVSEMTKALEQVLSSSKLSICLDQEYFYITIRFISQFSKSVFDLKQDEDTLLRFLKCEFPNYRNIVNFDHI